MGRTRKAAALTAAMSLAALGLGACTDSNGGGDGGVEPVTLTFTWWGNDDRAGRMNEAIARYQDLNEHVTINGSFTDYGSYFEVRTTEAAARNLPDVMLFDYLYISDYAQRDLLLTLDSLESLDMSGVDAGVISAGVIGAQQVAVPLGTNVMSVISNPAVYEAAGVEAPADGVSWEELEATWQELTRTSDGVYGTDNTTIAGPTALELVLLQNGQTMFEPDGSLGFDEQDLTAFLQSVLDAEADDVLVPSRIEDEISPQFALAAGVVGSRMGWDNTFVQFLDAENAPELTLTVPPPGSSESGLYAKPALMLSGAANTDHPEEVAAFIDFMINDAEIGRIFGASRGVPVTEAQRRAMSAEGTDAQIVEYQERVADLLMQTPAPPPAGWSSLEAHLVRIAGEVRHQTLSVEDAVAQFFQEAETLLNG